MPLMHLSSARLEICFVRPVSLAGTFGAGRLAVANVLLGH